MADLSKNASRRIRRAKMLRTNLPPWWPVLQVALGVVLAFGLIISIGRDTSEQPPSTTTPVDFGVGGLEPPVPTTPDTAPADTEVETTDPGTEGTDPPTTDAGTTAPSTTLPDDDMVTLPDLSGTLVQVPATPVERARAVVLAAYGDVAVITAATVTLVSSDRVVLQFEVDADGPGPVPATATSVVATRTEGVWVPSL
jgi:cytoskeletal protein RodZ